MPFAPVSRQRLVTHRDCFEGRQLGQRRQEYLDGVLYPLLAVDLSHQLVMDNLVQVLRPQLVHGPGTLLQDAVIGNGPVPDSTPPGRFSHAVQGIFARPDLVLTSRPHAFFVPTSHVLVNPEVLIEVVLPAEEDYYTGSRFEALRTWLDDAWHDYLLVASGRPEVAHYRRQSARDWPLTVHTELNEVVSLARVGCQIMVGELYVNVRDKAGRPFVGPSTCPNCGHPL